MDINVVVFKRADGKELFIGGEMDSSFADILDIIASEVRLAPSEFVDCSFRLTVMDHAQYNDIHEYVSKD